jgi:hypothetical protein
MSNDFSQASGMWCALRNVNIWLSAEIGGGFHVLNTPGVFASSGIMVNPFTLEVCIYFKVTIRTGFGVLGVVGGKVGIGLGPNQGEKVSNPSGEVAGDVVVPIAPARLRAEGKSGGIGPNGGSIGLGPAWGAGVSAGVDVYYTKVFCINSPHCGCN